MYEQFLKWIKEWLGFASNFAFSYSDWISHQTRAVTTPVLVNLKKRWGVTYPAKTPISFLWINCLDTLCSNTIHTMISMQYRTSATSMSRVHLTMRMLIWTGILSGIQSCSSYKTLLGLHNSMIHNLVSKYWRLWPPRTWVMKWLKLVLEYTQNYNAKS